MNKELLERGGSRRSEEVCWFCSYFCLFTCFVLRIFKIFFLESTARVRGPHGGNGEVSELGYMM